jgi:hypothetical protein
MLTLEPEVFDEFKLVFNATMWFFVRLVNHVKDQNPLDFISDPLAPVHLQIATGELNMLTIHQLGDRSQHLSTKALQFVIWKRELSEEEVETVNSW